MGDGQATRRRLLDAAAAEFARYGIAGARVDRIAAAAPANKAQIYAWFTSKDGLFDAVFAEHLALIVDLVPLDATDLPGYAVRLYDSYLERPEVVLLATWARLERVPTGDLLTPAADDVASKLAAIREAQDRGLVTADTAPADVYSMVIALSMAWSPASVTIAAGTGDDPAEHERRRTALAAAVRGAFTPAADWSGA
ncbi:TetR family transcriptional regulator [Actinomycetospora sp. CA-101289]|uniref:TetR family transcriptional regulator n=1 Tax=Actinomycetospora sp. CA-101289 TaxID=3239893 RepID=UPI003D96C2D3